MRQLESFVPNPFPVAFIFHGPTGVGKKAWQTMRNNGSRKAVAHV